MLRWYGRNTVTIDNNRRMKCVRPVVVRRAVYFGPEMRWVCHEKRMIRVKMGDEYNARLVAQILLLSQVKKQGIINQNTGVPAITSRLDLDIRPGSKNRDVHITHCTLSQITWL